MPIAAKDLFVVGPSGTALDHLFKATFLNKKSGDAKLVAAYIEPGTTVIDIGSNVGNFSRVFADANPGGMVLAFEPQSMPRAIAATASFFRRARNIVTFPMSLGPEPGFAKLRVPVKSEGKIGIGLAHTGDATDMKYDVRLELVPCETLDRVLARLEVGRVSLIKIDVEGGELDVLKGALETLARHRPVVVAETSEAMGRFGDTPLALREFMAGLGYRAQDLRTGATDDLDKPGDTVFLPNERAG